MTQGKIERWHQTLKNRVLLESRDQYQRMSAVPTNCPAPYPVNSRGQPIVRCYPLPRRIHPCLPCFVRQAFGKIRRPLKRDGLANTEELPLTQGKKETALVKVHKPFELNSPSIKCCVVDLGLLKLGEKLLSVFIVGRYSPQEVLDLVR
jgi:hypothetical protein